MRITTFMIFREAAIDVIFFLLSNLMQEHKKMQEHYLTQFTVRTSTPP
jgi:hypothetical protein